MYPINNYRETALRMKSRASISNGGMVQTGVIMGYDELLGSMKRECSMLRTLIHHLEKEIDYVVSGDIEHLEESMPMKTKILEQIRDNRSDTELLSARTPEEYAQMLDSLKKDLSGLWKQVSALNENSKDIVSKRLVDINMRLEPFIKGLKTGYDKSGKISKSKAHTIKPGA